MEMTQKRMTVGLLAHVDAGKTTLAEGILYLTGSIRAFGRVDHQDAFLDTFRDGTGPGDYDFFQTGGIDAGGIWQLTLAGHAGTCGFFRGDGADLAGA